ncbi:acetyltransferase [Erwinia phage AH06]|nr:acetyltransferase [Erwinia phage AH06]
MIRLDATVGFTSAFSVLPFIQSLDVFYPDISHWYINTVIPGLCLGNDKLIIARDNNVIAGIALGKMGDETKLRCIRVHPNYQSTGLGIRLIDDMLELIEDGKPAVTVSEEMLHLYSRPFVKRYGFELSDVSKGRYRRGKLEYGFNGA